MSGQTAAGGDGLSVLLSQPLSLLLNFLPQEKKDELDALLAELNG